MSDAPALLELDGAGHRYPQAPPVLENVGLRVEAGRALAMLGRNGSGKTTLLRLLSGSLRPTSGRLLLDGEPVRYDRGGLTRLRRAVQLVLQDPDDQLFSASVAQDVSFGPLNLGLPEEEVRARVTGALEALGIARLRDRPTHLLSFGQRKRAAIAGAVAMGPRVLVLDEPTAGLDPHGQERLLTVLGELRASGSTVVMATHDVDLALRWADEVVLLLPDGPHTGDAGRLLADEDLLEAAGLRPTWAHMTTRVLRSQGLLGSEEPAPRTPRDVARHLRGPATEEAPRPVAGRG